MFFVRLVAGVSMLALVAATAQAQTTTAGTNKSTVNDPGVNNQATVDNAAEGNDFNDSVVTFIGQDNRATVLQIGDYNRSGSRHEGKGNVSSLRQSGERNSATVLQVGQQNESAIEQRLDSAAATANDRTISLEQRGSANSATIRQIAAGNSATVVQGVSDAASYGAVVTLLQRSAENSVRIHMTGGAEAPNRVRVEQVQIDRIDTRSYVQLSTDGHGNENDVYQAGNEVNSVVSQSGVKNSVASRSVGNLGSSYFFQQGSNHTAALAQDGDGQNSRIMQMASMPGSEFNAASVQQRGSSNASEVDQQGSNNSATVVQGIAALRSVSGSSRVGQYGMWNIARLHMFEGGRGMTNFSAINQYLSPGAPESRHFADVSIRGYGNYSVVTQYGRLQSATVSMLGGGEGVGNSSGINQDNAGHVARLSSGSNLPGRGFGNRSNIDQRGEHQSISHVADVWQRGRGDVSSVQQVIRGLQDDGGATANVSQLGEQNIVDLRQVGRHSAFLTQGLGQQSTAVVKQYDSGGGPDPVSGSEARTTQAAFRGNNNVVASQYGDFNMLVARQEGSDNIADLWQKVGSAYNDMAVNQGFQFQSVIGAPGCSSGCRFATASSAVMIQEGRYNRAEVNQYGKATARVEQAGAGSASLPNIVYVTQTGAGSSATVIQRGSVGPSSAGDPQSGNTAEQNRAATGDPNAGPDAFLRSGALLTIAQIFQTGAGSVGSIEQQGRGQYGLIEQRGENNRASILQELGATNATAVIVQTGNGNSYSVTQNQPGQYIHVTQSGNNNAVTSVVARGPGS